VFGGEGKLEAFGRSSGEQSSVCAE
jgi:hypothetical protein